jgi:AcrR family transcriptional regulator
MKKAQKPKPLTRGEPVVQAVLQATLEEMARTGYGALTVEGVALRAGVNKTTVYRRWPTKGDLVRASLVAKANVLPLPADAGNIHDDLVALLKNTAAFMQSLEGLSIMRVLAAESATSEVSALAQSLREEKEQVPRAMIQRAESRGQLPKGTDAELLLNLLFGAIHHRILILKSKVDDVYIGRLVDLVLTGARRGVAPHPVVSVVAPKVRAAKRTRR